MMMSGSFMLVVLAMAIAAVVIVLALVMAYRRRKSAVVTAPVCGACGYHLAPNPMGLTVCPECGGDFLSVGILAPNMKLGHRGSPAVPLGIAWFILVGIGMIPLHGQLVSAFTRMVGTNTVTQTSSGRGPFNGVSITARRVQVVGEKAPDTLTADVTLTGPGGKDLVLVVDGKSKAITEAPAGTGLIGLPWDAATAKKIIAALGGEPEAIDDASVQKLRSIIDDALAKTAGSGGFGGVGSSGMFSSSSSSSSGFFGRGQAKTYDEAATSSSFIGSAMPTVIIGPLRGTHWATLITCAAGLTLAFAGLWLIVFLTRAKRQA